MGYLLLSIPGISLNGIQKAIMHFLKTQMKQKFVKRIGPVQTPFKTSYINQVEFCKYQTYVRSFLFGGLDHYCLQYRKIFGLPWALDIKRKDSDLGKAPKQHKKKKKISCHVNATTWLLSMPVNGCPQIIILVNQKRIIESFHFKCKS